MGDICTLIYFVSSVSLAKLHPQIQYMQSLFLGQPKMMRKSQIKMTLTTYITISHTCWHHSQFLTTIVMKNSFCLSSPLSSLLLSNITIIIIVVIQHHHHTHPPLNIIINNIPPSSIRSPSHSALGLSSS